MPDFDLTQALGLSQLDTVHFVEVGLRLAVAALLGTAIAHRPWRRFIRTAPPPSLVSVHAQTLIAVSGALMVVVIGDSVARAFGLVGLGGFIRFRSGIKDPRDAAVMFIVIGIGMACGLGRVPLAVVATVFAGAVLAALDATSSPRPSRVRAALRLTRPRERAQAIVAAFPGGRLLQLPNDEAEGEVVLEFEAADGVDAGAVLRILQEKDIRDVRHVALEDA